MTNTAARAISRPHGQLTRQAGPLPRVRAGDLLPDGAKIRGMNITHTAAEEVTARGNSPFNRWSVMWANWDTTALQTALDHAMSPECNTVRIQGTVYGVWSGMLTQAQYLSRWDQFSGWCQQRGLFLYPTGCDGGAQDAFGSVPVATAKSQLVAWAKHMQQLPDVIGLDLVQEDDTWRESADGLDLYQQVKAAGVTLPLAYSQSSPPNISGRFAPNYAADRVDFFDFHIYYANADVAWLDTYWNGGGTRPVLVGEFGHNNGDGIAETASQWVQRFDEVLAFTTHVGAQGQRVAGAQMWASQDTCSFYPVNPWPYSPADNFGLFDYWGNERTWLTATFKQFPKA